ncbi:MAG: Ig-like domain-containing protein [Spirochaetia bacterium]|nr:Ig-like domain-containing protein [Spirochaetia bacterium]
MNNYFKKFNLILCLSLTGLFTFSCRIGLGASVDTEPPKISIESPAASAVIRDSFALKGNVSDDKGIKSIEAVFTSTDSKGYSRTFTGDVTDESWKCIISDMPDGSFEVTVTATDHSNHTTTASRQFTIDNTPPLVVLQRPSSKATADNSSTDSYGQLLTLEGQAADDNDVDHIDVSIFKDAAQTQLLKTVTLKNVPPTISLDVAQFVDGVENDYSTIYGTTSKIDDTRYFYLSLKVYDGAKRYPVDGERSADDDNGNATTSYYLYSDLSGSVLSNYKVTDVYHMLSGFYSDSNVSNSVKQQLESVSIKESRFSLNPENSPTYTVTGRSWLTVEKDSEGNISPTEGLDKITKDYYLTNDTAQLVVEVSPGLDGSSILPETIGVYLLKTNNVGEPENNAEKIWIVKPETAWGDYPAETAPLWSDRKSMSGSSYKFSSEKNISASEYGLKINACYRIYVVGKDNAGNQLNNTDTKFCGFYLASSGATMSYKLMEQEDYVTTQGTKNKVNTILKIRPTDKNKFYAYRMFSSSIPRTISKDMFYDNGKLITGVTELEIEGIPDSYEGADSSSYSAIYYDNDIPLEYVDDNDKSTVKKYLMYLILDYKLGGSEETDVNLQNTYDSYLAVKIDDIKPTTTIKQPVASYKDDTKYIDDTSFDFRLESKDSDSGIEKLEYVITKSSTAPADGDAAWISTDDYTGGVYDFSRNLIEGENSLAEGKWYLYAKSTDAVGLVSDTVSTWFNVDKAAPALTVSDLTEDSKNLLNQTITIDGNNKYLTITGTIDDSNALHGTESLVIKVDDVNKVSTKIDVANDHTATAQEPWTYTKSTKTWTYKLPVGDVPGTLKENSDVKLEVIAKDIVNRKVSREFTLYYDTHKPIASISSPDTDYSETQFISADKFDFKIDASDSTGSGIKTISYVFSRSSTKEGISETWVDDNSYISGDKYITKELVSGNGTPENAAQLTEGKWYLYVKATDKVGLTSDTICRAFNVDKSTPDLRVKVGDKQLSEDSTNAFYEEISNKGTENEALVLTGTVSDTNALSKLEISVDGQNPVSITPNKGTWEYNLRVGPEDGTLQKDASISVNLTATDAVSRKTSKDYIVYYDTKAPTLDVSSPAENISVDAGAYKIKGNVVDDGFGLTTLVFELRERGKTTVLKDENNKAISGTSTYDATTKKWSGSGNYPLTVRGGQWYFSETFGSTTESAIPLGTKEGSIDLYVKATENSAVTSRAKITEKTVPFYFDSALPGVNEDGIQAKGRTTNTNFTLKGKVWDSNEVASVSVSYDENGITKTLTSTGDSPKVTLGSVVTAKTEATGAAWSCPFEITSSRINGTKDGELSDGTYTFTITATDAAGKTATVQRTVTVDTIKPEMGTNVVDGSQGTKIGDNYWFSTNQVPILIRAEDDTNGTGISKVEYSLSSDFASSAALATSSFKLSGESSKKEGWAGTVTCSREGANTIYVRATDTAGNKIEKSITAYVDTKSPAFTCTNLNTTITGTQVSTESELIVNGTTDITIILSDVADDETSGEGTFAGLYTSATENAAVQIVELGSTKVDIKSTYDSDSEKYILTIPKEQQTKANSGSVKVQITDRVGHSTTTEAFKMSVDTSAPTIKITSPTAGKEVNKVITVSGEASDTNKVSLVTVTAKGNSKTKSYTFTPKTAAEDVEWSVNIDTTYFYNDKETENLVLSVTAKDSLGNETIAANEVTRTIKINQNLDRPKVVISNLDGSGTTLMYGNRASISGTVEDDDGIENFAVVSSAITDFATGTKSKFLAENSKPYSVSDGSQITLNILNSKTTDSQDDIDNLYKITPARDSRIYKYYVKTEAEIDYYDVTIYEPETGIWTFYPHDASDANKSIYFVIQDTDSTNVTTSEGSTTYNYFYTTSTNQLYNPKVQFKSGTVGDNKTVITYLSDSKSPEFVSASMNYKATSSAKTEDGTESNVNQSTIVGGNRKFVQFVITCSDAAGISRMQLKVVDSTNAEKQNLKINTDAERAVNDGTLINGIWTTPYIDVSDFAKGGARGVLTFYDGSGLYNNTTINFTIDNDAPSYSGISPLSNDEVTGQITITGNTTDIGDAGVVSTRWIIPTYKTWTYTKDATATYEEGHFVKDGENYKAYTNETTGDTYSRTGATQYTDAEIKAMNALVKDSSPVYAYGHYSLNSSGKYETAIGKTSGDTYSSQLNEMDQGSTATSWTKIFTETEIKSYDKDDLSNTYVVSKDEAAGDIYLVPFYIVSEDAVGNISIKKHVIRHNPDANIPRVTSISPNEDDYDEIKDSNGVVTGRQNYVTMGGTIKINGTAQDNVSISKVFLQIDPNPTLTSGKYVPNFDSTDKSTVAGYTSTGTSKVYTITDKSNITGLSDDKKDKIAAAWWGIEVEKTTSWNKEINKYGELNPSENGLKYVCIRACALDNEGNIGAWCSPITIAIDMGTPKIGEHGQRLYKYNSTGFNSNSPELNIEARIETYSADKYLRGNWYFVVSVEDESGISECEVYKDGGLINTSDYTAKSVGTGDSGWGTRSGKLLYIPVDNSSTTVTYTVYAKDADGKTSEKDFTFNIDNDAPIISSVKGNSKSLLSSPDAISNSNYRYQLESAIADNNSGLDMVAFYFERATGTTDIDGVYDVMLPHNNTRANRITGAASKTVVSGATPITFKGLELTGTTRSTDKTVVHASLVNNANIRTGGLIFIGGMYHRIDGFAKATGTITLDEAVAVSETNVFLPYAQVIDNADKWNWNETTHVYDKVTDDDDNMVESLTGTKSGGYSAEASFDSSNIYDGPINLVIVAFDKAGNTSGRIIETSVQNNRPQVSKIWLGTDLTGDGKYADSEFEEYDVGHVSGTTSSAVITTAGYKEVRYNEDTHAYYTVNSSRGAFTVKDKLVVVPEFVGGNGDIQMVFNPSASDTEINKTEETAANRIKTTIFTSSHVPTTTSGVDVNETIRIGTKAYILQNNSETATTKLPADSASAKVSFTFWDSTDGLECGSTSQWAYVRITDLAVDCVDDVAPKVIIDPFKWTGRGFDVVKNSDGTVKGYSPLNNLYYSVNNANWKTAGTGGTEASPTNSEVNGHIELVNDIDTTKVTADNFGTNDPKVSGKIVVRGTAYDDVRLDTLWVSFAGMTLANKLTNTVSIKTAANAMPTLSTNGEYTVGAVTYYQAAKYTTASSTWSTATATIGTEGWEFKIVEDGVNDSNSFFNQKGHRVTWELYLDTAKIPNVAQKDVKVAVLAVDGRGQLQSSTSVEGTASASNATNYNAVCVPSYQMDVVPYITSVDTYIYGKLKSSIRSAYSRTSLGNYIVRNNEEITIHGFNLGSSTVDPVITNGTKGSGKSTYYVNGNLVVSTANMTSGNFALKVGVSGSEVDLFNNYSNNNAKGSFTGTMNDSTSYDNKNTYGYNRMPNNSSNNLLTDDIIFDVWQFNSAAAKPVSGKLSEPVMRINPKDGRIGFAFVSGPADFSMSQMFQGQSNSYTRFQHNYATFNNVSFVYDSNGIAHGTTTGLDTYPEDTNYNYTLAGRFTYQNSKWGTGTVNSMNDNYDGTNKVRLEAIGIPGNNNTDNKGNISIIVNGTKPISYTMTETRFASPTIATTTHGTAMNQTSVYLAYYDDIQKQIRFRYATLGDSKGNYNNFNDNGKDNKRIAISNYNPDGAGDNNNAKRVFESTTNVFSLIAGKDWQQTRNSAQDGSDTNYKYTRVTSAAENNISLAADGYYLDTGSVAGKYVAIDALAGTASNGTVTSSNAASGDTVVAVWFDGTNCNYSYIVNPTSGNDLNAYRTTIADGYWSKPKVIFSEGGEYCNVKFGPDGSVHIAANVDGVLKYAYLKDPAAISSYVESTDSVVIDSYSNTGTQITIDVGYDKTRTSVVVPYIGYYNESAKRAAVAHPVIKSTTTSGTTTYSVNYKAQGTSDSVYTGNWEISIVPTASDLSDALNTTDKVSIGLWKTTTGVIKNSTTGSSSASNTSGNCWGNGTAYPVLGYSVVTTSGTAIETAQMK